MTGDGRKEADMIRTVWGRLRASLTNTIDDDRGDVPGWVLVKLMTAGLVVAVCMLAGPALADVFGRARSRGAVR